MLRGIVRQSVTRAPEFQSVIRGHIQTLLAMTAQMASASAGGRQQSLFSQQIDRAIRYMWENLDQRVAVSEMAQAAGEPESSFRRRFRAEMRQSPSAYHLRLRLDAARECLGSGEYSILDAAIQYGFQSSQHFGTCFARAFGITPGDWRRQSARDN